MYRVALEGLLGVTLHGGNTLRVDPCIPPSWDKFEVTLSRAQGTEYVIVVANPHGASRGVASVELDGSRLDGNAVPLVEDGRRHEVRVLMAQQSLPAKKVANPRPTRASDLST
jgi:cyclic beta-1,2-glucan synthetase